MFKQDILIVRSSTDFKTMVYILCPGLKNSSDNFTPTRAAILLINSLSSAVCYPPTGTTFSLYCMFLLLLIACDHSEQKQAS